MKIALCSQISFDDRGPYKYKGAASKQFREAWATLAHDIKAATGDDLHFVAIDDLRSDGVFDCSYFIESATDDGIRFRKVDNRLQPDVVINRRKDELYDHPYFTEVSWHVYNNKAIAALGNKAASLEKFACYMPKSSVVASVDGGKQAAAFLQNHPDVAQWVLKPLRLNGGRGITLVSRDQALDMVATYDGDVLLQEFCETSDVPELGIEGRHDVRVYVIDGQQLLVAVRQPKAGGYLANTAVGGSIRFVEIEQLPDDAVRLIQEVSAEITAICEHYFVSIDIFYTNGEWKLIEVNDQPGLPAPYQTSAATVIMQKLIKSLRRLCDDAK